MKWKIALVALLVIPVLCFVGCRAESGAEFEMYQSVVSDVTTNLMGVKTESEAVSGYFQKSEMEAVTKTIEFRGEQYCGRYEKSSK